MGYVFVTKEIRNDRGFQMPPMITHKKQFLIRSGCKLQKTQQKTNKKTNKTHTKKPQKLGILIARDIHLPLTLNLKRTLFTRI